MAEGVGFEPTEAGHASAVFKTAAFDRSAIPPGVATLPHATDFVADRGLMFTGDEAQRTIPVPTGEVLEWSNRAAC